jgi:hypothetical protein
MIERKRSDCKYVEIFIHHVGSIGTPSRRTMFIRGTNTKHWEVPNITSRNKKTNIFLEGSAGFKTMLDLKESISVYVENVDLISVR